MRCGILVFLVDPQRIEPFQVDKANYGARTAWIAVPDILALVKHDR